MIITESVKTICVDGMSYDIDSDAKVKIEVDECISIQDTSITIDHQQLDDYMRIKGIPFGMILIHTENSKYVPKLNYGHSGWVRL